MQQICRFTTEEGTARGGTAHEGGYVVEENSTQQVSIAVSLYLMIARETASTRFYKNPKVFEIIKLHAMVICSEYS